MIQEYFSFLFNIFNYISQRHLVLIILLTLLCIGAFTVIYITIFSRKYRINKSLEKNNFNRMFIVDLLEKNVSYFDNGFPSNRITIDLDSFYETFKADSINFSRWIKNVVDKNPIEPDFYLCFNYNHTLKEEVCMLYRIIKINYTSQIVYLESILFKSITKHIATKDMRNNFFDEESIINYYNSLNKYKKKSYAIYIVNTFENNIECNTNSFDNRQLVLLSLVDRVAPSFKKSFLFYFINNHTLCFIDFNAKKENDVRLFAKQLDNLTKRIISFKSLETNIDYRISVNHVIDKANIKDKIRGTLDLSVFAKNSSTNEKVIYYNKNINMNKSYHSIIVDELNRILRFNAFKVLYTPYADIKTGRTRGYIEEIQPVSDILRDIHNLEVESYNQGRELDYLNLLIDNSIKPFNDAAARKKKRMLFIPLFFPYLIVLNKCLLTKNLEGNQLVFVLDEADIYAWKDKTITVKSILEKVKNNGLQLALNLTSTNITLDEEILNYFTFAVISKDLIHEVKTNAFNRILLNDYIAKHGNLEYIALGIDTWSGTELLLKLGIDYLSGPIIAESQETLEDVSKKASRIISDFNE